MLRPCFIAALGAAVSVTLVDSAAAEVLSNRAFLCDFEGGQALLSLRITRTVGEGGVDEGVRADGSLQTSSGRFVVWGADLPDTSQFSAGFENRGTNRYFHTTLRFDGDRLTFDSDTGTVTCRRAP